MKFTQKERAEWEARWRENRIGFHLETVNPYLIRFQEVLLGNRPQTVLVPLAGKTKDLPWLAERVPAVVGVELSEIAVKAFFAEQDREFSVEQQDGLILYHSDGITMAQGDFFTYAPPGPVDAIYDRAALIALPPERRPVYADRIVSLLKPGGRILLVSVEYDPAVVGGPPFSVPVDEVRTLFSRSCDVEHLIEEDTLHESPNLARRGVSWLRESVFAITRR